MASKPKQSHVLYSHSLIICEISRATCFSGGAVEPRMELGLRFCGKGKSSLCFPGFSRSVPYSLAAKTFRRSRVKGNTLTLEMEGGPKGRFSKENLGFSKVGFKKQSTRLQ